MRQLYCDICGEVAYELGDYEAVHHLDGCENTCPGCGAVGHIDVDADEMGATIEWRSNRGEWERLMTPEERAEWN